MPIRIQSFSGRSCFSARQRWVALPRSHFRRLPEVFASNRRGHLQPIVLQQRYVGNWRFQMTFFDVHPELFREDAPILMIFSDEWLKPATRKVLSCFFLSGNCGVGIVRWFESRVIKWGTPTLIARMNGTFEGSSLNSASGWWFQRFFIFTPIWGRFPIWLIFFRWRLKPPTSSAWSLSL